VPYFIVFQAPTGRWVVRGPFATRAAATAGQPQRADPDRTRPGQIVEAAHGMAAAQLVFRALRVPGYRTTPPAPASHTRPRKR
jgi:hypothetical protein